MYDASQPAPTYIILPTPTPTIITTGTPTPVATSAGTPAPTLFPPTVAPTSSATCAPCVPELAIFSMTFHDYYAGCFDVDNYVDPGEVIGIEFLGGSTGNCCFSNNPTGNVTTDSPYVDYVGTDYQTPGLPWGIYYFQVKTAPCAEIIYFYGNAYYNDNSTIHEAHQAVAFYLNADNNNPDPDNCETNPCPLPGVSPLPPFTDPWRPAVYPVPEPIITPTPTPMYTLEEIGRLDVPGKVESIDADTGYLYISTNDNDIPYDYGLAIVDISDTSDPLLAGTCTTPGWGLDIVCKGNYAYIGDQTYGIQIIDATDRTKPVLLSSYNTPGYANTIDGDLDNVYVLDTYDIRIIDAVSKTNPVMASLYNTSTEIQDVKVKGNFLYFVDNDNNNPDVGLKVLEISDNTNPFLAGEYTGMRIRMLTVRDTYVYTITMSYDLVIFDITDPIHPVYTGVCSLGGYPKGLAVEGNYLYYVSSDGLYIADISNPAQPFNLGLYDYQIFEDIAVKDNYLYCLVGGYTTDVIIYTMNDIQPSGAPTPEPTIDPATPTPTTPAPDLGDVNNDGEIDIIDALLIAQYYVGLNPQNFIPGAGDVNCDGFIDIIDALLVAQFYVGLITQFC